MNSNWTISRDWQLIKLYDSVGSIDGIITNKLCLDNKKAPSDLAAFSFSLKDNQLINGVMLRPVPISE